MPLSLVDGFVIVVVWIQFGRSLFALASCALFTSHDARGMFQVSRYTGDAPMLPVLLLPQLPLRLLLLLPPLLMQVLVL